ncbi:ZIP family metal transporter [Desulfolucanica intricata]|uniref:ZIP family metal transporter n=1 Tax=Desulfolucanica intricata TaxID=1285191 RepID=UPI000A9A3893|nr:ZIP family metal transporter [Desulfolucanica intricata]
MGGIIVLSLIAGLGTCLGAVIVVMFGSLKARSLSFFLGLASGVMTAVIIFDLIPSSLRYGNLFYCLSGFAGGIILMLSLEFLLHYYNPENNYNYGYLKMGYLIALGIALHDFPEGLAIAAGYAAATNLGPVLTLAIGLHNIPEGMATAAPLWLGNWKARNIIGLNALVSMVTPAGTLLGLKLLETSNKFISLLLSFAAGAMAYIVYAKLFPESRNQHRPLAFFGCLFGFICLIFISAIA